MACCEACGQQMPKPHGYTVDSVIVRHPNGTERRVPAQVARFIQAVLDSYPGFASRDRICRYLWPNPANEVEHVENYIGVAAHKARRVGLVPLESDWKGGYRLAV